MLLPILLFILTVNARCALTSPVSTDIDGVIPELKWYEQYYVEVEKFSVLAAIVENTKVWHTSLRSRVDYYDGVTKRFIYSPNFNDTPYGVQYEIRPETTKDEPVCRTTFFGLDEIDPVDVLPVIDDFVEVGIEIFRGLKSWKFERNFEYTNEYYDIRETLWASYDRNMKKWIPLRYIQINYSPEIGSMTKHDIWDFYNYNTKFSLSKTFDNYVKDCKEDVKTIMFHQKE